MKLHFTEDDIFQTAVEEVIGEQSLKKAFSSGKKLRVKFGIDPTSPNIHLGRSIQLWRLRAFQELGHDIHLLVGDFTGQIGDTSDKDAERPMLSAETIQYNLSHYLDQVWMVLNPEKKEQVHIHYNSEWLGKLTLAELGHMADAFSVNQFVKRELIARRLEAGSRVSLREMLYPLMQGYDSVVLKADVELGGSDQRFNLLAGRILQEQAGQPQQSLVIGKLINGTDGRKMSSSWGNVISLLDTPEDKFGKLMTVHDAQMAEYLWTMPISARPFTKEQLSERIAAGENPRDLKLELAQAVTGLYHGEEKARQVRDAFIAQFTQGQKPEDIDETSWDSLFQTEEEPLVSVLVASGLVSSKTESRRLIEQRAVRVQDEVVADQTHTINKKDAPVLIQVGKRRFLRLV